MTWVTHIMLLLCRILVRHRSSLESNWMHCDHRATEQSFNCYVSLARICFRALINFQFWIFRRHCAITIDMCNLDIYQPTVGFRTFFNCVALICLVSSACSPAAYYFYYITFYLYEKLIVPPHSTLNVAIQKPNKFLILTHQMSKQETK